MSFKRIGPNKTLYPFPLVDSILFLNKRLFSLMENAFPAKILNVFVKVITTTTKKPQWF